ncbi:MAG: hypothetical protein CSA62_05940 [Planctomycetota bacterium]|nr:MAG: hypothetical protein CSA62_05940 [Planctomycetota bacterium]
MSSWPVLIRCLVRGLELSSWLILGAGAFLALLLGRDFGARGAEEQFGLLAQPLSWLPLLAVLCAAAQALRVWPAHSPSQPGYRSLWLMGAPIARCRVAAWLGGMAAGLLLLAGAGLLLFLNLLGQPHPDFARAFQARFADVLGRTPWISRPGEFQELRVPKLQQARRLRLEPLYVFASRELADSWAPVQVEVLALGLDARSQEPLRLGKLTLAEPGARLDLELPPELPTPCAIRLVREPGPLSFSVSFELGTATVEHERVATWRASIELGLQYAPWLALVLSLAFLVARFAPPALSPFAWLLVLPALASLPGLETPATLRSLLLGQVPSWAQLGREPWLIAGALLLVSLLPARPRVAAADRSGA